MSESDYEQHFDALRGAWYGLGGHQANRAWAAFVYLEKSPQDLRVQLLRYLCENFELWDTSEQELPPPEYRFSEEEANELATSCGQVLDALLEAEIALKPSEADFYQHLWNHIHNPFFSSERQRAFALYWALIDLRIPYFQVGSGLKMSDEQFQERQRGNTARSHGCASSSASRLTR